MALFEEVKSKLASTGKNSIRKLEELPDFAPGYIVRDAFWYGVGVPYDGDVINENFANARIRSAVIPTKGSSLKLLLLECGLEDVRNQFAALCAEFLDPGYNNAKRHALIADPHIWWKKWRELLGNTIKEKRPYQILGELITLEYLIASGENAIWQGASGNTQDIDADTFSCEVKSTTNRYTTEVTISSKFQLVTNGKPLKLAFARFEPANTGDSLAQAVDRLCALGCDRKALLLMLARQGVVPGNIAFTTTYNLLELRFYNVDKDFPLITDNSFVEGHMPSSVVHFTYTIDLAGLPFTSANVVTERQN